MVHRGYLRHFLRDVFILVASIIVAILLVRTGFIESFLGATHRSLVISSLIAGAFFTSVLTIAPAGVALIAMGQYFPPILVAFFGAIGAVVVDLVIVTFIRKDISADLESLSKRSSLRRHVIKAFHFGFIKWVAFFFGMFLIAAPVIPDEVGLFLISVSKINPKIFPLVLFLANFVGIFLVVSLAQVL